MAGPPFLPPNFIEILKEMQRQQAGDVLSTPPTPTGLPSMQGDIMGGGMVPGQSAPPQGPMQPVTPQPQPQPQGRLQSILQALQAASPLIGAAIGGPRVG